MPTTPMGQREELRKNLPIGILEPLAEALIEVLFSRDDEAVITLCSSFLREIGLNKNIEIEFEVDHSRWDHIITMKFSTTFDGVDYAKVCETSDIQEDAPALADDKNKGAMIFRDIVLSIDRFMSEICSTYLYGDPKRAKLYDDAIFKMGMMEI